LGHVEKTTYNGAFLKTILSRDVLQDKQQSMALCKHDGNVRSPVPDPFWPARFSGTGLECSQIENEEQPKKEKNSDLLICATAESVLSF